LPRHARRQLVDDVEGLDAILRAAAARGEKTPVPIDPPDVASRVNVDRIRAIGPEPAETPAQHRVERRMRFGRHPGEWRVIPVTPDHEVVRVVPDERRAAAAAEPHGPRAPYVTVFDVPRPEVRGEELAVAARERPHLVHEAIDHGEP